MFGFGALVKSPKRMICGEPIAPGELVRITETGSMTGTGVVEITVRGAGQGGGGWAYLSGVADADGEHGANGATHTGDFYLRASWAIYIGAPGDGGASDTASIPGDAEAEDGAAGGPTYITDWAVNGIAALGGSAEGRGAFSRWNGGNSYKSNYVRSAQPLSPANPDGSNYGQGGSGGQSVGGGFDGQPGAAWITLKKAN